MQQQQQRQRQQQPKKNSGHGEFKGAFGPQYAAFPFKPATGAGAAPVVQSDADLDFGMDLSDPLGFDPVVDSPKAAAKKTAAPAIKPAAAAAAALPAFATSAPIPIPGAGVGTPMQMNSSLAALYGAQARVEELKVEQSQLALSRAQTADQKRSRAAQAKEDFKALFKQGTKLYTLAQLVDSVRALCNQRADDALWDISSQAAVDRSADLENDFEANWRHFIVSMWAGKIANAIAYIIQQCSKKSVSIAAAKPKLWDFITDDQRRYSLAVVVSTMHMRGDGRWKKDKDYADNALDEAEAMETFINATWFPVV